MINIKKFTYASAFAGIGGMSMAFEELGGECVIAWEYDPTSKRQFAQEAHKLNFPHIRLDGDITKVELDKLPNFDLLCFTPPCQPFSVAGNQKGFDDTRGTLIFNILEIINTKKPKALFMENVKGLINHDNGKTLETIIKKLSELGYNLDYAVINSFNHNVPQSRERVYLVGVRCDIVDSNEWEITKSKDILNTSKKNISKLGLNTFNFDFPKGEFNTKLEHFIDIELDDYYIEDKRVPDIMANIRDDDKSSIIAVKGDLIDRKNPRGQYGFSNKMFTIRVAQVHAVAIKQFDGGYRIRKLSPIECLKLQSVPIKYIEILKDNFNDSRIYKFAGNGLTINVVKEIGLKLIKYIT